MDEGADEAFGAQGGRGASNLVQHPGKVGGGTRRVARDVVQDISQIPKLGQEKLEQFMLQVRVAGRLPRQMFRVDHLPAPSHPLDQPRLR